MITTRGKTFFKNYLANQAGQVAGAVSFGIGATAASAADQRLQFEFARVPLDVVTYDAVFNRLVFKGTLPQEVVGAIYEVGVWTSEVAGTNPSDERVITTFDSEGETWTNATFNTTNARIGPDNLRQTPAASGSSSASLDGVFFDLYDNPSTDTFVLAYNCANGNTSAIRVRFRTDPSNYYDMNISNPTAGYHFDSVAKGAVTVTGSPDWSDINSIEVTTVSKSSGASDVTFDGLRLEDNDTFNLDYGMIARFVPVSFTTKPVGRTLDFEYTLAVSV